MCRNEALLFKGRIRFRDYTVCSGQASLSKTQGNWNRSVLTHSPHLFGLTFPIERMFGDLLLLLCFIEIHVFDANNVDPDQTPRIVASDLGLHCVSMSILGVDRTTL